MKFAVYTSCSVNYLPKARALAQSLRLHHPESTLTLCLNDVVPSWLDLSSEPFDTIWLPEDLGYDRAWIFQHNVMELCTAVKGRALKRLLAGPDVDYVLYLDPDVYVFHPLDLIAEFMAGGSIGLVPHILRPEETDIGVRLTEMSVTEHGIYNLGHLVVRPDQTGRAFADWWSERLDAYCFDDRDRGLFTDQRWADLVPAIFENVTILRQSGLDVASWNLFGRHIKTEGPRSARRYMIDGEPMLTYHFSGTGPNGAHRRVREIFDPGNGAIAEIEQHYEQAINRNGQRAFCDTPFGFDVFDDQTPITAEARKLYRRHSDLQGAFANPFDSDAGEMSFQTWLRSKRPGVIDGLQIAAAHREMAFRDLFDGDYYISKHPDAADAIKSGRYSDALDHYAKIGSQLFLDPNPFFASHTYHDRAKYHDSHILNRSGCEGTLLWHYLESGLPNAIEPLEFFDSRWYLAVHPDLMTAFRQGRISTPLAHFLHNGSAEGRDPGPDCDAESFARFLSKRAGSNGTFVPKGALGLAVTDDAIHGSVSI